MFSPNTEKGHTYEEGRWQRKKDKVGKGMAVGGRGQEKRHMADMVGCPGSLRQALEGKNTSWKDFTHAYPPYEGTVKQNAPESDQPLVLFLPQGYLEHCSSTWSTLLEKTRKSKLFNFSVYPLIGCNLLDTGLRERKTPDDSQVLDWAPEKAVFHVS